MFINERSMDDRRIVNQRGSFNWIGRIESKLRRSLVVARDASREYRTRDLAYQQAYKLCLQLESLGIETKPLIGNCDD